MTVDSSVLHGETGNDWVGVSGHLCQLFGGAGNDWLGATGSGNVLDGGTGNDTLVAATAAHQGDVFNYRPGYAQDEIQGFARHNADGTDVISIQGFGVTTFGAAADADDTEPRRHGDHLQHRRHPHHPQRLARPMAGLRLPAGVAPTTGPSSTDLGITRSEY